MLDYTHALQSNEYLNEVTDIVWNGCKGSDIQFKENWFITPDYKGFVTNGAWPDYDKQAILKTVQYISEKEPYANSDNMGKALKWTIEGKEYWTSDSGKNIIMCKNNHLDVYGTQYFWNGIEIKMKPLIEEHNFFKFQPSISFISFSPFEINFFPITIIGLPTLVFFIFNRKYKWISININIFGKKENKPKPPIS